MPLASRVPEPLLVPASRAPVSRSWLFVRPAPPSPRRWWLDSSAACFHCRSARRRAVALLQVSHQTRDVLRDQATDGAAGIDRGDDSSFTIEYEPGRLHIRGV